MVQRLGHRKSGSVLFLPIKRVSGQRMALHVPLHCYTPVREGMMSLKVLGKSISLKPRKDIEQTDVNYTGNRYMQNCCCHIYFLIVSVNIIARFWIQYSWTRPVFHLQLCSKVYIPPDIFPLNAIVDKWCKIQCFGNKNASDFSKYDAKSRFRT